MLCVWVTVGPQAKGPESIPGIGGAVTKTANPTAASSSVPREPDLRPSRGGRAERVWGLIIGLGLGLGLGFQGLGLVLSVLTGTGTRISYSGTERMNSLQGAATILSHDIRYPVTVWQTQSRGRIV